MSKKVVEEAPAAPVVDVSLIRAALVEASRLAKDPGPAALIKAALESLPK